jgi:hypothetical protein
MQLDEQSGAPVVVAQSAVGAMHLVVQLPQVAGTVRLVSHPRSPLPAQCADPAAHDVGGIEHTPARHWTGAPGFTLSKVLQSWPQVPQFMASVFKSTHFVTQRSGDGLTQLDEHIGAPIVVEHRPVGATQFLVQLPQVAGADRLVSHPRSAAPAQWANPEAHDVGGMEQTPATH